MFGSVKYGAVRFCAVLLALALWPVFIVAYAMVSVIWTLPRALLVSSSLCGLTDWHEWIGDSIADAHEKVGGC